MNNDEKFNLQLNFTRTIHSVCVGGEELGIISHEVTCNVIDIIMNYFQKELDVINEHN